MNSFNHIILCFATGAGVGFLPKAPGTWGSVVGFALAFALRGLPTSIYALTVLTATLLAVWVSAQAAQIFQRKDPAHVVIDEIVACLICMWGVSWTWPCVLLAFALFRVLDALKPWPINRFEALPGGWGIVMDDIVAGAITCGVLHLCCP